MYIHCRNLLDFQIFATAIEAVTDRLKFGFNIGCIIVISQPAECLIVIFLTHLVCSLYS